MSTQITVINTSKRSNQKHWQQSPVFLLIIHLGIFTIHYDL